MNLPTNLKIADAHREVVRLKVGTGDLGWSPRLRQHFGYLTPDEHYEATLLQMINSSTDWLDVGCGHDLLPSNKPLAELLSKRCHLLVGVDPSPNIEGNALVHERAKCTLEQYQTDRQFDLISLRMVAEHVAKPATAVAAISRLVRVGGKVIVYTVGRWSVPSLVAAATPMAVHHVVKRVLWGVSPEDTFPTVYRMNTRTQLQRLFAAGGFDEESFLYLNDCRSLARWRITSALELAAERTLRTIGVCYPDFCLLGIYRRQDGKLSDFE